MKYGTAAPPRRPWSLWITGLGPLGVLTGASWIGTVTAPTLAVSAPLVLMALSPRLAFLLVAAGAVPAPVFFGVALARLVAADPSHYLIGRTGGGFVTKRAGSHSPLVEQFLDRVRQAVRSRGLVVVALRPNGLVLGAAGAFGLRPLPVAVADISGTCCYLALVWIASRSASPYVLEVSVVVTRALVLLTAGAFVCAGAWRLVQARATRRDAARRSHPSAGREFPRVLPSAGLRR